MRTVNECRKRIEEIEDAIKFIKNETSKLLGEREGLLFVLSNKKKEKKDAILQPRP